MDEIVANFTTAGPTPAQYWAADERGSLVNLTAGSGGSTTVINTYDEYGVPASGNLGRFQYTGQMWMPDFDAYNYKARAYQPGIGRFLQTDPIGYESGANLYGYVGADPVNWVDPLGLQEECADSEDTSCVDDVIVTARRKPVSSFELRPIRVIEYNALGQWVSFEAEVVVTAQRHSSSIYGHLPGWRPAGSWTGYTQEQLRHRALDFYNSERNSYLAEPVLLFTPGGSIGRVGIGGAGLVARGFRAACNCFVEGTQVQTQDGLRPIEDIEVGDLVLARDETTGETSYRPVTALIRAPENTIWELTIENTDVAGNITREVIGTTDDHPWRTTAAEWVETKDLSIGAEMVTVDGDRAVVVAIRQTDRVEQTFNFEVEGFHTYFVGDNGLWVHNACFNPFSGKTPQQIDRMFRDKGFSPRGPDPLNGRGGYVNPRTGRSYHIDEANSFGEPPHVDVNRPRGYDTLPKRKIRF